MTTTTTDGSGAGAAAPTPRVGVYVDGFNLYYGARTACGRNTSGWRWLDLPKLASSLLDDTLWPDAQVTRVSYCTADRDRTGDPSSILDQQTYIGALEYAYPTVVDVHRGRFVPRDKTGVLVRRPPGGGHTAPVPSPGAANIPGWLPAREVTGAQGGQEVLVTISTFEEKGSDVNVATTLLLDVLRGQVDAAIVISNDSDLELPLKEARLKVPVGTVNPNQRPTARALRGESTDGVGRHWWRKLDKPDYTAHQLPDPSGGHIKPTSW